MTSSRQRLCANHVALKQINLLFLHLNFSILVKSSAEGLQHICGPAASIPGPRVVALNTSLPDWRAGLCNLLRTLERGINFTPGSV